MLKKLLVAFIAIISLYPISYSYAQSATAKWSEKIKHQAAATEILGQVDGNTYIIETLDFMHYLRKLDKNLNNVFAKYISPIAPSGGKIAILKAYLSGKQIFFIGLGSEKVSGKLIYFTCISPYSLDGEPKGKSIEIGRNDTKMDYYKTAITYSADKSKLMIISFLTGKNKIVEKFSINVVDANFKPIWSIRELTPGGNKTYTFEKAGYYNPNYMNKYAVDNNGNAYIVALVEKKGVDKHVSVLSYHVDKDESGDEEDKIEPTKSDDNYVKEWAVSTKDGKGYNDFIIQSGIDGSVLCSGPYTLNEKTSGLFYMLIDGKENEVKANKYEPFNEDILAGINVKNYTCRKARSGKLSPDQYSPIKAINRKGGGYYVLLEATGIYDGGGKGMYHNGLIAVSISAAGKIEWTNFIQKFCGTTWGFPATYAYENKDGNLSLFYNEHKDNKNVTEASKMKVVYWNYSKCVLKTINFDNQGKYESATPIDYSSIGVQPMPGQAFMPDNNTIIMYAYKTIAFNDCDYKMGIVKLK